MNKKAKVAKPQSKTTHDYYCCCSDQTKHGIPKGVKITQIAQHCKNNAKQLVAAKQKARQQEVKKISEGWKQIGLSLTRIIENS